MAVAREPLVQVCAGLGPGAVIALCAVVSAPASPGPESSHTKPPADRNKHTLWSAPPPASTKRARWVPTLSAKLGLRCPLTTCARNRAAEPVARSARTAGDMPAPHRAGRAAGPGGPGGGAPWYCAGSPLGSCACSVGTASASSTTVGRVGGRRTRQPARLRAWLISSWNRADSPADLRLTGRLPVAAGARPLVSSVVPAQSPSRRSCCRRGAMPRPGP